MTATMTALLVTLGGGLGAMLRFAIDQAMTSVALRRGAGSRKLPWGIVVVNLSGSLLLGLLVGTGFAWPALSLGMLGGFTTFSTASLDTVRLYRERQFLAAAAHAFGTLVFAVLLALAGVLLGEMISGRE